MSDAALIAFALIAFALIAFALIALFNGGGSQRLGIIGKPLAPL
ncbi:MAG: hypothetical protein WA885_14195 [Phormidesmis sp.]